MADYKKIVPFIKKWEGGFVNDPNDAGGATNMGVTIGTFRQIYGKNKTVDDLKNITEEQWNYIFKSRYWNKIVGDAYLNQSVANIMADWVWMSGTKKPVVYLQQLLGVADDGIIGRMTIAAINSHQGFSSHQALFDAIKARRVKFFADIVKARPQNQKFFKGWLNRLNAIKYVG